MKKHINKLILITLIIIMVVGQACEQGFEPEKKNIQFGFYFLKDTTKTIEDIFDEDIKTLELKDEPWISEKDIEFYDWSSHCIYLKKDKSYFFPGFESFTSDFLYKLSWVDRPLIVVANGKKCYASYFFGGLYSIDYWPYPDIFDFDIIHYPRDVIYAEWPYPFAKDLRSNEDVKNVLNIQGLLHEGLHITIDSLWIDNADTVTIRYKITVKNNDTDNLYILDPDKMGSDLFHYFNNGPIFYNSTNNIVYRSNYKKVTSPPLGTYEADWFTKIEDGKSITRIIILKGYPKLLEGNYYCSFDYNNPYYISKDKRVLADGRYWIGPTSSELVSFNRSDSCKANFQKIQHIKIKQIDFFDTAVRK